MNITTATPVEIDTKLFGLYLAEGQLQQRFAAARESVMRAAGAERSTRGRSTGQYLWDMTFEAAEAKARKLAATDTIEAYVSRDAKDALAKIDEVRALLVANRAEQAPLHAEFDRRPWTRAFLVQNSNGHVHRDMRCSTCFDSTRYAWMVDYSGATEAEIVEAAGERACTTCYRSAPVDALKRPTRMFGPDEIAAQAAREQRATEKLARENAKAAKQLVRTWNSGHWNRVETISSAWSRYTDGEVISYYDRTPDLLDILRDTLVGRDGMDADEFTTLTTKKINDKVKRLRREGADVTAKS